MHCQSQHVNQATSLAECIHTAENARIENVQKIRLWPINTLSHVDFVGSPRVVGVLESVGRKVVVGQVLAVVIRGHVIDVDLKCSNRNN